MEERERAVFFLLNQMGMSGGVGQMSYQGRFIASASCSMA